MTQVTANVKVPVSNVRVDGVVTSMEQVLLSAFHAFCTKVQMNDTATEATFGNILSVDLEPWKDSANLEYRVGSFSLDQLSYYRLRVSTRQPSGDAFHLKNVYLNTADSTSKNTVILGIRSSIEHIKGATVTLEPEFGLEFPKWLDGIVTTADSTGFSDDGLNATQLYDYIKDRLEAYNDPGLKIVATTNFNGLAIFTNLPEGNYTLSIEASGFITRSAISVNVKGEVRQTYTMEVSP